MEQAQEKKPGKNMLWGGRFTGMSMSISTPCAGFGRGNGDFCVGNDLLMRLGVRGYGSAYGVYGT